MKCFLHELNTNNFNLSFTYSYSEKEIPFLDILISLDQVGVVDSTPFRKSMAGNSLLRADSAHSEALKKSIPFAQYMRIRRICTSLDEFDIQAGHLQKRFLARGYSRSLLKRAYKKARSQDRRQLLFKNSETNVTQPQSSSDITRRIFTFSNQQIKGIFEKYWFLLTEDPVLSNYVASKPSITYRRAGSLKDELISSHFVNPTIRQSIPPRTIPCGSCEACPFLDIRNQVILPNGERLTQRQPASCHTSGVIYLLQCP